MKIFVFKIMMYYAALSDWIYSKYKQNKYDPDAIYPLW